LNATTDLPRSQSETAHAFIVAWVFSLAFYFLEYAVRSSPAVMIPELAKTFGVSTLGVSDILGTYYYTYSTASLVAGVLLDRLGAKYVVSTGMAILGIGCLLFMAPQEAAGYLGRLLQGAGSAFAFTGAVYLASHGLPARRLATAIGVTQCVGMLGGTAGHAVFAISMVPLGWVFGCPLLGWLADRFGRRKPVYLGGAAIMLIGFVQLIYAPTLLPSWLTLFILGVASGAAMIPYTIIKEVNPDEVKGSATGAINFLTFAVTAAIGPIFAERFGRTLGAQTVDVASHFRHAGLFWISVLIAALVVGSMLRETGRVHPTQAA
jgi:MFS family permease